MLARSHQLQGIFGLLKPFIHVHILICFVDVYQNHGVVRGTTLRKEAPPVLPLPFGEQETEGEVAHSCTFSRTNRWMDGVRGGKRETNMTTTARWRDPFKVKGGFRGIGAS